MLKFENTKNLFTQCPSSLSLKSFSEVKQIFSKLLLARIRVLKLSNFKCLLWGHKLFINRWPVLLWEFEINLVPLKDSLEKHMLYDSSSDSDKFKSNQFEMQLFDKSNCFSEYGNDIMCPIDFNLKISICNNNSSKKFT